MDVGSLTIGIARECTIFAAFGFAVFAVDEAIVDGLFLWWVARRRVLNRHRWRPVRASTFPISTAPGTIAIFVPAWDESNVIKAMLEHNLAAYGPQRFQIYVGCYPNDRATIEAVQSVADPRVRVVVGPHNGPTTKADCLNTLWRAARDANHKGIVLHDAEDLVSRHELRIFDAMLERFDLVQLPVVPLPDPGSRWVAGHYCDEFAESHGKSQIVREMLGAAVPSAGVGCAIRASTLEALASERSDGAPFDPGTLTEDYELGLRIRAMGGTTRFVSVPDDGWPGVVATCAHFPDTVETSVRQKTRWIIGIALAGWDRLGWRGGISERWMRWRDRRALLAAILLTSGYVAMLLYAVGWIAIAVAGGSFPVWPAFLVLLMKINLGFLAWRLVVRGFFVRRLYGTVEGLRAIPRLVVANIISIMAARRAVVGYAAMLRAGRLSWDKTLHKLPIVGARRL